MSHAYLIGAARTPIGKFLQAFANISAPELAAISLRATLERSGLTAAQVEEVILGNVVSAGVGQAPARQAALNAGLGHEVDALLINQVCGSGLKAVMLADRGVRAGDRTVVAAGGMESMSRAPYLLENNRGGWKYGHQTATDALLKDGLWCSTEDVVMGEFAEYTAEKHGITRADQDAFSAESHRRAVWAMEAGKFEPEITPVEVKRRRETIQIQQDEGPRSETTMEGLGQLRPAFDTEGSVTAGNASQLSDGAATVIVTNQAVAAEVATGPKARILATATTGVAPKDLFIAPVSSVQQVLSQAKLQVSDVHLFELNEAFASQAVACMRTLELPPERVNVWGGAIALGHPIGASGARVLVTLMHALADRNESIGVASLCLGGGNAVSIAIEMCE